jgi:hypothetical protein
VNVKEGLIAARVAWTCSSVACHARVYLCVSALSSVKPEPGTMDVGWCPDVSSAVVARQAYVQITFPPFASLSPGVNEPAASVAPVSSATEEEPFPGDDVATSVSSQISYWNGSCVPVNATVITVCPAAALGKT